MGACVCSTSHDPLQCDESLPGLDMMKNPDTDDNTDDDDEFTGFRHAATRGRMRQYVDLGEAIASSSKDLVYHQLYREEGSYPVRVTLTGLLNHVGGVLITVPPPTSGINTETIIAQCCDLYDAEMTLIDGQIGKSYRVEVIRRLLQTTFPHPTYMRVSFVNTKRR
jgi:hypothetical protein